MLVPTAPSIYTRYDKSRWLGLEPAGSRLLEIPRRTHRRRLDRFVLGVAVASRLRTRMAGGYNQQSGISR